MSARERSRLIRWATPRFPLEMLAASALTLVFVLTVGDLGRQSRESAAPVKLALQAAPRLAPAPSEADLRAAEFIENFALAHVSAPLPEEALNDPDQNRARAPLPPRAVLAAQKEKPRAPASRIVAARPPARPGEIAVAVAEPATARTVAVAEESDGFRIPVVSDVAATIASKIPSGRDVLNGVGSVGRRIGSLLGRG